MIRLTKDEILLLQKQLIDRYGGMHGIRDEGLLDSALNTPFQGFDDHDFYPVLFAGYVDDNCDAIFYVTRGSADYRFDCYTVGIPY